MILVHLSVNGRPAILDATNIMFAEECVSDDTLFTRIYLKQPLPDGKSPGIIDVEENVDDLLNAIR